MVASGYVLRVNRSNYEDLYWALRGDGNNFAIMTRLDLEVFEHGDVGLGA